MTNAPQDEVNDETDLSLNRVLIGLAALLLLPCFAGPFFIFFLGSQLYEMHNGTIPARGVALRITLLALCVAVVLVCVYLVLAYGGREFS